MADNESDVRVRRRRQSPEALHDEMTPTDIVTVLESLRFTDGR